MLYIIFLTGICNLKCEYCGGTIPEEVMPFEIKYNIDQLKEFMKGDSNAVVAFYGGEPLLRINIMKEMMDALNAKHFVVQTNGIFLSRIPEKYLKRLDAILVSIDGRSEVTDFYRGRGVYKTIVNEIEKIRDIYKGDLIARMVVTEKSDIYREVTHLLSLPFDHIHWQLNVVWAPENSWKDFNGWVRNMYNPGISKLVKLWAENLKNGKILGIVPFLGVLKRMIWPEDGVPCGAGRNAVAITTDGRVLACPIGGEFKWNELGTLENSIYTDYINRVDVSPLCKKCDVYRECGGRCLFANKECLWGEEGFNSVCATVKHLVYEIRKAKKVVDKVIESGLFELEDFRYPPFNNTTEIIP